jgi:hypothetical protein
MKKVLVLMSYIGLALTAIPAFFVFTGKLSFEQYKSLMIAGAVLWFLTAPFWIDRTTKQSH